MRVLRCSKYMGLHAEPLIGVTAESEISGTVEDWVESQFQFGRENSVFVICDVFDVPAGTDIVTATLLAGKRQEKVIDDEANMAVLYFWALQNMKLVSEKGFVVSKSQAPLDTEQIEAVFRQIGQAPAYKHQSLVAAGRGRVLVTFKDGVASRQAV